MNNLYYRNVERVYKLNIKINGIFIGSTVPPENLFF
jgi:hypothetical protein